MVYKCYLNGIAGRTKMTIERTVILEDDEVGILKEWMRTEAGRRLDIRRPEEAMIYGLLYQITLEEAYEKEETE